MPRKQKKYHYIYKTTNLINGKFYIGMHSTNDLNDGYLGSGTRLRYSLNKYGEKNHQIKRLEFFSDREKLRNREIEIVNESLLKDPSCMNLTFGGTGNGNWMGPNKNSEVQRKKGIKGRKKIKWLSKNDPEWSKKTSINRSKAQLKTYKNGRIPITPDRTGKPHKQETKNKIGRANSIKQKGKLNSQYGTHWITNEKESKKIHKGDNIPNDWRKGRKMSP